MPRLLLRRRLAGSNRHHPGATPRRCHLTGKNESSRPTAGTQVSLLSGDDVAEPPPVAKLDARGLRSDEADPPTASQHANTGLRMRRERRPLPCRAVMPGPLYLRPACGPRTRRRMQLQRTPHHHRTQTHQGMLYGLIQLPSLPTREVVRRHSTRFLPTVRTLGGLDRLARSLSSTNSVKSAISLVRRGPPAELPTGRTLWSCAASWPSACSTPNIASAESWAARGPSSPGAVRKEVARHTGQGPETVPAPEVRQVADYVAIGLPAGLMAVDFCGTMRSAVGALGISPPVFT